MRIPIPDIRIVIAVTWIAAFASIVTAGYVQHAALRQPNARGGMYIYPYDPRAPVIHYITAEQKLADDLAVPAIAIFGGLTVVLFGLIVFRTKTGRYLYVL